MEATATASGMEILIIIANGLVGLAILGGLFYLLRKHKTARIILIVVLIILAGLAALITAIYGNMGKGYAL